MNFNNPYTLYVAYAASNLAGLLLLGTAVKMPRVARLLFSLLFGWACWVNYTTSHAQPQVYLLYANYAIGPYVAFIQGWFSRHITVFVSAVAIGQGLIAVGLWLPGWPFRLACVGIIVFMLAIAPLGIYAAFPLSLTVGAAAYILLQKQQTYFNILKLS